MKKKKTVYNNGEMDVINTYTGEIHDTDDKCVRKQITITEFYEEDDEINDMSKPFMEGITFIKSFRGNGVLLNEKLSNKEIATLIFLTDFICYDDFVLRQSGNKKGKPLSVKELAEYKGDNYDSFRKVITSLKKKEVIGIHTTGDDSNNTLTKLLTVNPYIFCRGKRSYDLVSDFYSNTFWAKVKRQTVRDLGVHEY